MTDFSEAYDSVTDQINSFISTQINAESTWNAIPGGLDKVSTSSMGFAWGIGKGIVYSCQLPCNGEWKVDQKINGASDIVTDDTHVYVLSSQLLFIKSANGTDEWLQIATPSLISIFCTSSYIWGQDSSNKKYRLAKPGITGNWVEIVDASNTKITSASGNSIYGIDILGSAMKTDEAMQSGWSVIPDFIGTKYSKIMGEIDNTALYGLDTTNQLKRCVSGKCDNVNTKGYTPQNISIEPQSKTLWMTSSVPGTLGNIFTKQDSLDSNEIFKTVTPLDKQRDDILTESEKQFQDTTHTSLMTKQIQAVSAFLSKFFNINLKKKTLDESQKKHLEEHVS